MGRIFLRLVLGGLAGKLLGLLREVLLAALFGAGKVVAANRIALTATLIPINFFTADALTAGFLPLYVQYRQERPAMALALYRSVRSLLIALGLALALGLILGRHSLIHLLGPGLDPHTSSLAATMLGIAALGVPFYIQYNLYTLVALAHDSVHLINLRASIQSLGLISTTIIAYKVGSFAVLAWGFTVPYILLFAWGFFWLRRHGYLRGPQVPAPHRRRHKIALTMFWRRLRPLLLIPVILQGSIAVERAVGSLLGVEVVAATDYARFLVDSLMALVAAPLGLAGLASFAKLNAHDVTSKLRQLVPPILLVTIPLSVILCLHSSEAVALLYARGQFDNHAVSISSVMLLGFALGIWAQVVGYTFVKILNARGANFQVAIVTALSFSSAIVFNLLMYRHLGAITLGLSSSLCGVLMFIISAHRLGILRFSAYFILSLLPGVAAIAATGFILRGPGLMRLSVSCGAILIVWLIYIALVPQIRPILISAVSQRLGRIQDAGAAGTANVAGRAVGGESSNSAVSPPPTVTSHTSKAGVADE